MKKLYIVKKAFLLLIISLSCSISPRKGLATPIHYVHAVTLQEDLVTELAEHFRTGNAKEISKYFSSTVRISLLNSENVYSSAQSEIILDSFFRSNPTKTMKILHRLDSHINYQHVVLLLGTSKGDYRIALSLKGAENDFQLIELRIEEAR